MEFKRVADLGSGFGSDVTLLGREMPMIEGLLLMAFILLAFMIFMGLTSKR